MDRRADHVKASREALAAIAQKEAAWHEGTGAPTAPQAIRVAETLLDAWTSVFAARLPIRPTLAGGFLSEIQIGAGRWALEIEADGKMILTIVAPDAETIDRPITGVREALHSWLDFLLAVEA